MNRMWWGLLGVAILAGQSGCRTCGENRFRLFKRESCDVPTQLTNLPKGNDCPPGATSLQPGPMNFPMSNPTYGPAMPSLSYPPATGNMETIPPTFVPATPIPAVPGSAKNVLPLPQPLVPPVGVVGYPK